MSGPLSNLSNPHLDGHKLVLIRSDAPPTSFISDTRKKYPGLEIVYHQLAHRKDTSVPQHLWDDVTMLMSYNVLPTREQAPKLQYVQLSSAGANHVHGLPLYEETDISFCTANGVHPPQIAEWVISTFLAFQHHIPRMLKFMESGAWGKGPTNDVEDSVGLRMGILGYGAIGRQCARVAKAMAMDVVAYTLRERATLASRRDDSYCVPGTGDPEGVYPSAWFHGTTKAELNNFLSQDLDVLVICLPLTKETRNMIAAEQFQILAKKKTFLSNIGRGPHVNTEDLITALHTNQIRGAALDVTDPEPLPKDHPLWKAPNLIITPHTSGHSKHYFERVLAILDHNLGRVAAGEEVINKIDRGLTY